MSKKSDLFHIVLHEDFRSACYDCKSEEDIEKAINDYFYECQTTLWSREDDQGFTCRPHKIKVSDIVGYCTRHYRFLKEHDLLQDQDECSYITIYRDDAKFHKWRNGRVERYFIDIIIMGSQKIK